MKALTVRQPWADAIVYGAKRCENRSWPLPARYVGARILLHAAKASDRHAVLPVPVEMARTWPDTRGALIATATLIGSHLDASCCRPWGMPLVYHWELADVVPLAAPVPAQGQLGFWTPDADTLDAVTAQTVGVAR